MSEMSGIPSRPSSQCGSRRGSISEGGFAAGPNAQQGVSDPAPEGSPHDNLGFTDAANGYFTTAKVVDAVNAGTGPIDLFGNSADFGGSQNGHDDQNGQINQPSQPQADQIDQTAQSSQNSPESFGSAESPGPLESPQHPGSPEPALPATDVYLGPISIRVSSPQKITEGASAFVAYLITSERPGQSPEHVRRRFSDFVKLYSQLAAEYAGCAVPPLPDHSRLEYIAGDRFKHEFTSKRAVSLERFLFRLVHHPELSRSRALAAFLTPRDLASARTAPLVDSSVIDTLSDHLLNVFAKVRYQSKEMLEARDKADRFEHNVGSIDHAFARMTRHQADLVHELGDVHRQSSRLASVEPTAGHAFETLATAAKAIASATATLHTALDATFAGALRDMIHYVQAIKQLLKQREQRQIDYEALVDYLHRSESSKASAEAGNDHSTKGFLRTKVNDLRGVDNEHARSVRIQRLDERIDTLKQEVAKAKKVSNQFEEVAKREMAVFEATEALEMKACLASIADAHISYYKKVLQDCRALE